jgi:chromosome segregation ATPase
MMSHVILALFVVSPIVALSSEASIDSTGGVQKVIQMLGDMSAKVKDEKNAEQVAFAEFETWCKMEIPATKKSIAKGGETIELLNAEIAKLTSQAKVLGEEIGKLQSDVATFESEKKAATAQREKDNKAYIEESTDYGESVDALDRAIVVLMKKTADKPAASAVLLQLAESDRLPAQAKSVVASFLGLMGKDFMGAMGPDYEAPEANAYENQSGGIIEMLKKLKDQFRTKLADCQKEEMNSKHAYDMVVQDLVDSIENSNQSIEEKKITKARKEEKAAQDKKELASTQTVKAEDEKTLADMEVECKEKKLSFGEKQQLRTEEIEAIAQATKILESGDVSGNAAKHLDLAQTSKAAVLTQLRGESSAGGVHGHVRDFLASEGRRLHSPQLSLLAQKVGADPFGKVKKMIDDMITRLLNEANEDAQHEGFCDKEIGKSKVTRNKLSEDIDGLNAAVKDGEATIMMLAEEIKTLTQEVADLDGSVKEATKIRNEEKPRTKSPWKMLRQPARLLLQPRQCLRRSTRRHRWRQACCS